MSWQKMAKWGLSVFLLTCFILWAHSVWVSTSTPSAPRLAYVLCEGKAGPPGVKDFNSLPKAGEDPGMCFGAWVKREWDGRVLSLEIHFSDQMRPFNHTNYGEGTLRGWSPSARGSRFGWSWQSYDTGTNRTRSGEEEENLLLYDEATGSYRGVYARKDISGTYSTITIRPQ